MDRRGPTGCKTEAVVTSTGTGKGEGTGVGKEQRGKPERRRMTVQKSNDRSS